MSRSSSEAYLEAFQRRFGELLRTPLDAASGTLRAQPQRYASELVALVHDASNASATERLAVYNRQYWFRLLTAMQTSWPLTARMLGLFIFNVHAQRFLLEAPPRHSDLRQVTLGFDAYLSGALHNEMIFRGLTDTSLPRAALLEAAALDAAFARVFNAPPQARLDLSRHDQRTLPSCRLISSAAYARVQEHWPLAALRLTLGEDNSERALSLPPAHASVQTRALFRNSKGVAQLELTPLQARLLELLDRHPIGHALQQLEAEVDDSARFTLPEQTQALIARGAASGFWVGVEE